MHSISQRVHRSHSLRPACRAPDLRSAILFGGCLLLLVIAGGAAHMELVEPGASVELREDEGLLIVHVDPDPDPDAEPKS